MVPGSREKRITAQSKRIRRVQLNPANVHPLADALQAIACADLITIGPGSLYTSLIPNILVKGIIEAIRASPAVKIYIQNIMTQPGETDRYSVADHVQALAEHCDGILFPSVLLNNGLPSTEILKRYETEHASLVKIDRERLRKLRLNIAERDLLAEDEMIRHDPDRLARAVFELADL